MSTDLFYFVDLYPVGIYLDLTHDTPPVWAVGCRANRPTARPYCRTPRACRLHVSRLVPRGGTGRRPAHVTPLLHTAGARLNLALLHLTSSSSLGHHPTLSFPPDSHLAIPTPPRERLTSPHLTSPHLTPSLTQTRSFDQRSQREALPFLQAEASTRSRDTAWSWLASKMISRW